MHSSSFFDQAGRAADTVITGAEDRSGVPAFQVFAESGAALIREVRPDILQVFTFAKPFQIDLELFGAAFGRIVCFIRRRLRNMVYAALEWEGIL